MSESITKYLQKNAFSNTYISYAQIGGCILACDEVSDYTNLLINGATDNVSISETEVPVLGGVTFSHKTVLKPFIRSLSGMDCDNVQDEISRIDCRCIEILKKMQVISKIAVDGLLDGSAFNYEKNELNIEYQKLIDRKKHLYDYTNENKEKIEYATTLYKFCSKSEMLNEYSDELFEKYVSRVIVYSRDVIGFELKCGIIFTERLG